MYLKYVFFRCMLMYLLTFVNGGGIMTKMSERKSKTQRGEFAIENVH